MTKEALVLKVTFDTAETDWFKVLKHLDNIDGVKIVTVWDYIEKVEDK